MAAMGSWQRSAVNTASPMRSASTQRYEDIDSLTGIYGLGDGSSARQLVAGLESAYMRDGTVYNEYRLAGTASGQTAADALGVRNLWHVAPGLNVTTSIERQQVVDPAPLTDAPVGTLTGTQSATAVALGVDYLASPLWKSSGRVEYRYSDIETDWLSTIALLRKLSQNWSLIARNIYMSDRSTLPGQPLAELEQDRMQLGVAYRDTVTNLWNALARYEYRTDLNNDPIIGTDDHDQIVSIVAEYHPSRPWEFQGQLAGKQVHETLQGVESNYSAILVAGRATWDFNPRWDIGLLGSTTTGGGTKDQGGAIEVGYRVIDNLWLSGGGIIGRYPTPSSSVRTPPGPGYTCACASSSTRPPSSAAVRRRTAPRTAPPRRPGYEESHAGKTPPQPPPLAGAVSARLGQRLGAAGAPGGTGSGRCHPARTTRRLAHARARRARGSAAQARCGSWQGCRLPGGL